MGWMEPLGFFRAGRLKSIHSSFSLSLRTKSSNLDFFSTKALVTSSLNELSMGPVD